MFEKIYELTQLEEVILWASLAISVALVVLPYENTNGKPLPAVIFKGQPSAFHLFVLALNFALFGFFVAISLRGNYLRIANCCLVVAIISLATGILHPPVVNLAKDLLIFHIYLFYVYSVYVR